jgi:L,D-transpeptidase catalytic domain/Sel1 repeat
MYRNRFLKLFVLITIAHLAGCAGFSLHQPLAATSLGPIIELPANIAPYRIVISVHDQRMALLKGSTPVAQYLVSTAKNGAGEALDSGRTPRGRHAIGEKIGAGASIGTVFVDREPTNEIIAINTPGRLPVVTRILRLRGVEEKNQNTFERLIYLHGSPIENLLGTPASGGCIRMRSEEIVDLFERVEVGTEISIFEEPMEMALGLISLSDTRFAELKKAGDTGDLNALGQLCYGHMYGARGISMDDRAALKWCLLAADKADPNAITLLGEINERGKGIAVNFEAARQLYERAAKLGHPHAQFKLAQMYQAGIGGVSDEVLAAQYLELSANQGYARAIKLMQVKAN